MRKFLQALMLFSLFTIVAPACVVQRDYQTLPSVQESEAAFTTTDDGRLSIEGRLTNSTGQFEDTDHELTAIQKVGNRIELHSLNGDSGRAMFIFDMRDDFLDTLTGDRDSFTQEIDAPNLVFEAGIIGCETDYGYQWEFDRAATHGTLVFEPVDDTTTLIRAHGEWRTDANVVQHLVDAEVFVEVSE